MKKKEHRMINPKLFPTIMILISLAAATVYMCQGDIRRTTYWAAAAVLTASVTY